MFLPFAAAFAAEPVCPAYTGIVRGATWRYRHTDAYTARTGKSGEWTVRVEAITGEEIRLRTEGHYLNEGVPLSETTVAYLWCDADGLWLLEAEFHSKPGLGDANVGPLRSEALIRPATLRAGQRWIFATGIQRRENVVVGPKVVRTPAGTFETLEVRYRYDHGFSGTWYFDARVGLVASEESELIEYRVAP
jgi:hypothetical protein